jgi:hypothetical protein
MKRVYILLLLLVVLWWVVFWMEDQKSAIIIPTPAPVQDPNPLPWTDVGSGDQIAVTSWASQTWGAIDDTELPLDQQAQQDSETEQLTDPEVEEIIDLLEELIAESERETAQ